MPESKPIPEFRYEPGKKFVVTDEMKKAFEEDGFIFVRGLMTKHEIDKLNDCLKEGDVVKHAFDLPDDNGSVQMVIWNHPGKDYTGMIGRMERIVDTTEQLMGGEVYHYHTKIVLKEPRTGGAFAWHQDYGYWYKNGILFPDLLSVSIAIDRSDTGNGCLRVLRGSHKLGRIDHVRIGGQNGADLERMKEEPRTGGAFAWHQDYGYWYKNGILFPDLLSVSIAIDRSDTGNGCLRVLRGSHKLGRIDHVRIGGQNGADLERMKEVQKVLEEVNVIQDPGDAIFFHCNVLHTSAPNTSDRRRYCIIPCYNRMTNDPWFDHHHARVTKLHKVPDSTLETCNDFKTMTGKWFMDPAIDKTIIAKKVNEDVESMIEEAA